MKKITPIQRPPLLGSVSRAALIHGMTDTSQIGMQQGDRDYSFDANLQLSDGAAAITATGWAQVGGADGIIDFGGNQSVTPVQQARIDAVCVIDITALDATTTDEAYRFIVVGSTTAAFTAGTNQCLGELELAGGVLSVLGTGAAGTQIASTTGRYELLFCTEQDDRKYQYVKLYCVLSGTSPSVTFTAFVAVLPEP